MQLAQRKRHLIMVIRLRNLIKDFGNVALRFHKRDACALAAFRLSLQRHNSLQLFGDDQVAHFNRNDRDTPIGYLFLNSLTQFLIKLMTTHNHIRQRCATDGIAQRRLRGKRYGKVIILDLSTSLFGIPNHPKQHGIDVKRYQITSQRLFGAKRSCIHALVNAQRAKFKQWDGEKQTRARKPIKSTQAHDHGTLPIHADVHRRKHSKANYCGKQNTCKRQTRRQGHRCSQHQRKCNDSQGYRYHHSAISRRSFRRVGAIRVGCNTEFHLRTSIRIFLPRNEPLAVIFGFHGPFSSSSHTQTPVSGCLHTPSLAPSSF